MHPWPLEKRFCNLLCMQLFSKGVRTEVLDIHTWELDVHQSADITIKDRWWTEKKPCLGQFANCISFQTSTLEISNQYPLHNDNNANVHLEWHENWSKTFKSAMRAKLWQKQGISWLSLSAFLSHEFSIAELCEKEEEQATKMSSNQHVLSIGSQQCIKKSIIKFST